MTVASRSVSALRKRVKRAGLTLIELIVVLFILAAIAGISLTYFANFQVITHGSTSASAVRGLQTSVALNVIRRGFVGNGFDNLVHDADAVPTWIANVDGLVPSAALTADQVDALNGLGILEVYDADSTATENVTFEGHLLTPETLTTASIVGELSAAAQTVTALNFNYAAADFDNVFAFGIGERCSMVGINGTIQEAPVHTPGEGSAATTYGRYVLLIGFNAADAEATYIGITCMDDGENFNNINRNLSEYLEGGE